MQRFTLKDQFRRGEAPQSRLQIFLHRLQPELLKFLNVENYFYLVIRQVVNTEYT